jgi:triacylglycerol lipase
MNNPTLFDPLRKPRNPIVLCHGTQETFSVTFLTTLLISGLYGFDVRGFDALPSLRIHYWSDVLRVLRKEIGADVVVTRVPPYERPLILDPASFTHFYSHRTGAVTERAGRLHEYLKENASGRAVNLIGHSMVNQLSLWN